MIAGIFFALMFFFMLLVCYRTYKNVEPLLEFIGNVLVTLLIGFSSYAFFTSRNGEFETWFKVLTYLLLGAILLVNVCHWTRQARASSNEWTEDDFST